MEGVRRAVDGIVAEGLVPSASIAVRVNGALALAHTAGVARLDPRRPATPGQVYDLASVTKALAGATLASLWLARGAMRPEDPAARWLPDVDPRVTVAGLLTHASGLPAWRPLYPLGDRAAILAAARTTPLERPGAHVYSDLGFLVLLQLLEALGGPIEAQVAALPLVGLRYGPCPGAAATEDCPVRGRVVEGEVHDLNAWAMGGASTHAGLFGSAEAVAAAADALLDAHRGARDDLPAPRWDLCGPGSHRGGWDGVTPGASSTGGAWPGDTVGHLGYTGTSVWVAPRDRVVVALLTNRVHPKDDKEPIRRARPRVHDAVAAEIGWRRPDRAVAPG